jgi:simple sugar transport system ATP-binding protein
LDVPWAEPVGKLSVGYRQRIELMKALYRDARVLLLDEPTAVLTPQEVQDFFAALRALRDQGRTVVVITHKLREVEELADDVTVLRRGRHIWTRERSAVQREDIIEAMMGRERVPLRDERRPVVGDVVLRLEQVIEERGPGQSRRGACQGVDLEVRAGEIVGVAGVEGAGQRSLVECALGLKPYMGRVRVLGRDVDTATTAELRRDGVGLIPESRSREGLWGEQSCYGNLMLGFEERFARCGFLNWTALESTAGSWAREFDVRAADLNGEAQTLSGGNQQKLIFAREVNGRKPKLLICCQPTRGVDIGAIDLIHQKILALRNHGVGVLLISSELDELFALSDRVYCLFDGAVSAEFPRDQLDLQTVGRFMTSRAEAPA